MRSSLRRAPATSGRRVTIAGGRPPCLATGPLDVRACRLSLGRRPLGAGPKAGITPGRWDRNGNGVPDRYEHRGDRTATDRRRTTATTTVGAWRPGPRRHPQRLRQPRTIAYRARHSPGDNRDKEAGPSERPAFFFAILRNGGRSSGALRVDRFGLSVALATPFAEDRSIDLPRLMSHGLQSLADGCDSLTVFGTTGEGASLGLERAQPRARRVGWRRSRSRQSSS